MEVKTFNRGVLKRGIQKGQYLVSRKFHFVDDATTLGETEFVQAYYFPSFNSWVEDHLKKEKEEVALLRESQDREDWMKAQAIWDSMEEKYLQARGKAGVLNEQFVFSEESFRGFGNAWIDERGIITLFFGFASFEFIKK